MSDRAKVIDGFESTIITNEIINPELIDQFISNATLEYAYEVEGASGLQLLEYTKSTFVNGDLDVEGTFNRALKGLEIRILSLYVKLNYKERERDGISKQIGYSTGNIVTKDLKAAKDAVRLEIMDIKDDISRLIDYMISPSDYNG